MGGNKSLDLLRSLGHINLRPFAFSQCLTHVVAERDGGSVRLPLSSKDGIAATAGCGNEPILREGTVATLKNNNTAKVIK